MKLYHYSLLKQPVLKPYPMDMTYGRLIAQCVMGDARLPQTRGMPWGGGLPFFQEPLPMPLLDEVIGDLNSYFPKGVEIYEYAVETNLINEELFYYVLDPMELIDFVPGAPGTGTSFPEKWLSVMNQNCFLGNSVDQLNSAVIRLKAELSIADRFRNLYHSPDFKLYSTKYTLGFPIVYLRARSGSFTPNQINLVSH